MKKNNKGDVNDVVIASLIMLLVIVVSLISIFHNSIFSSLSNLIPDFSEKASYKYLDLDGDDVNDKLLLYGEFCTAGLVYHGQTGDYVHIQYRINAKGELEKSDPPFESWENVDFDTNLEAINGLRNLENIFHELESKKDEPGMYPDYFESICRAYFPYTSEVKSQYYSDKNDATSAKELVLSFNGVYHSLIGPEPVKNYCYSRIAFDDPALEAKYSGLNVGNFDDGASVYIHFFKVNPEKNGEGFQTVTFVDGPDLTASGVKVITNQILKICYGEIKSEDPELDVSIILHDKVNSDCCVLGKNGYNIPANKFAYCSGKVGITEGVNYNNNGKWVSVSEISGSDATAKLKQKLIDSCKKYKK